MTNFFFHNLRNVLVTFCLLFGWICQAHTNQIENSHPIFKENFNGGVYIVDGDMPVLTEEEAQSYHAPVFPKTLLILNVIEFESRRMLDVWSIPERFNLTYCISTQFGDAYELVKASMKEAIQSWQEGAHVQFKHKSDEDGRCDEKNENVLFDVRPTDSSGFYLARAFFPSYPRINRNLLVDVSALGLEPVAFLGVLKHELGHVLGFRHEHIHAENNRTCAESGESVPVTKYDKRSVMHYPQCKGKNDILRLELTDYDREGAEIAYPFIEVYAQK